MSECKISAKDQKSKEYEEYYVWNPGTCYCETAEYLKNYACMKRNDSVITCCKIIDAVAKSYGDTPDTTPIDLINKKKQNIKWIIIFLYYFVSNHMFIVVDNHCN